MKSIDDIRRENLTALAKELGGVAALARKLDRSDPQVSQWIRGAAHSTTGRKRGMKIETARWIEATVGKPKFWLDQDHSQAPPPPDTPHRVESPVATYSTRPLVQQLCDQAERLDDSGLLKLLGFAAGLLADHPLVKAKRA